MMKNHLLRKHFSKPQAMGIIDDPTFSSIVKSSKCNDIVKMMVIVDAHGKIADIRTQIYGCGYAIAASSCFNELSRGLYIADVMEKAETIIQELEAGTPTENIACLSLPLKAFQQIWEQYRAKI